MNQKTEPKKNESHTGGRMKMGARSCCCQPATGFCLMRICLRLTFLFSLSVEGECFVTPTLAQIRPYTSCSSPVCLVSSKNFNETTAECRPDIAEDSAIPSTMSSAISTFWVSKQYPGPPCILASMAVLVSLRLSTAPFRPMLDGFTFLLAAAFWSIQEHVIHKQLLHAPFSWYGKEIHQEHHSKPYYHISMDPASLLLGWFWVAHVIFRLLLRDPSLATYATLGYGCAGIFYEWTHYLVHTRVQFPRNSFWGKRRDHHRRHHLVDNRYWLAFSVPAVDTLFGTNPDVRKVVAAHRDEHFAKRGTR